MPCTYLNDLLLGVAIDIADVTDRHSYVFPAWWTSCDVYLKAWVIHMWILQGVKPG